MPNPFDQFDGNPFDEFDEPSLASDVSQSALGGLIGGILGIQGSVGDADRAIQTGTLALADRLGFGPGRTVLDRVAWRIRAARNRSRSASFQPLNSSAALMSLWPARSMSRERRPVSMRRPSVSLRRLHSVVHPLA